MPRGEFDIQGLVIRVPLLPLNMLDRATTEQPSRLLSPLIRTAIGVASRSLATADAGEATDAAIARFIIRMSTRSTPFGLFAAVAPCALGTSSSLTNAGAEHSICIRPNAGLVRRVFDALQVARGSDVRLVANTTACVGKALHFVRPDRAADGSCEYSLVEIDLTPVLQAVLLDAARGAPFHRLASTVQRLAPSASSGAALAYLFELVSLQLLIPEPQPIVVGKDPLDVMADERRHLPDGPLSNLIDQVVAICSAHRMPTEMDLVSMETAVARVVSGPEPSADRPVGFRVDSFLTAGSFRINERVVHELVPAIQLLSNLCTKPRAQPLADFVKRFRERYADAAVRLLDAIDEERGIGFGSSQNVAGAFDDAPLLARMEVRGPAEAGEVATPPDARLRILADACTAAAARPGYVLELGPDTVKLLEPDDHPLPDAFACLGQLHSSGDEEIDKGEYLWEYAGVVGPAGIELFGRFTHADDQIRALATKIINDEERLRPDAVFAEIDHWPQDHDVDVSTRPLLRRYRIPVVTASGSVDETCIMPQDLWVFVRGDRIVIWSASLDREVIPRLSVAHRAGVAHVTLYRFLSLVATQDRRATIRWEWGPFESCTHTPRVQLGRVVLVPAIWRLSRTVVQEAITRGLSPEEALRAIARERQLPRYVRVAEEDRWLVIDTERPVSLRMLWRELRRSHEVLLKEYLGSIDLSGPIHLADGQHACEVVAPFVRREGARVRPPRAPNLASARAQRTALPADGWLYWQIAGGTVTLEKLLINELVPVVERFTNDGAIRRWFFVRFDQPDWHLRLRLDVPHATDMPHVLAEVHHVLRRWQEHGDISRVSLESYVREIERYGGPDAMDTVENIFHADSVACVGILGRLRSAQTLDNDARWLWTMRSVADLLRTLVPDVQARCALVSRLRDQFAAELGLTQEARRLIGEKYRVNAPVLAAYVLASSDEGAQDATSELLLHRERAMRPSIDKIMRVVQEDYGLASSLVHMNVNRLLVSRHRQQEAVIYDLLARLYNRQKHLAPR